MRYCDYIHNRENVRKKRQGDQYSKQRAHYKVKDDNYYRVYAYKRKALQYEFQRIFQIEYIRYLISPEMDYPGRKQVFKRVVNKIQQ